MGDSLLAMAAQYQECDFIGVEVHRPGVGKLLDNAAKGNINNLRVYMDDALNVLNDCIPDNSLSAVLIFFPDPWHKKRHHKRRLIQGDFVNLLLSKLMVGGYLHIATDWEEYAEHIQGVLGVFGELKVYTGEDAFDEALVCDVMDRPETKFERRGERLGHRIWEGIFYKHG